MRGKIGIFSVLMVVLALFTTISVNAQSQNGLRTVVIDPGHGGDDPGALGMQKASTNYHEKTIVLNISLLLGEKIKKAYPDVEVVYTRSTDVFVTRSDRARLANARADLFISVHCIGCTDPSANGSMVYVLGPKSQNPENTNDYFASNQSAARKKNEVATVTADGSVTSEKIDANDPSGHISSSLQWKAIYESSLLFAIEVVDHLIKAPLKPRPQVISQGVYDVLAYTTRPAVLLELAFMTNQKEYNYLKSAEGQEEIAERLFQAFVSYKTKYDASFNVNLASAPATVESSTPEASASTPAQTQVYYGVQIMSGTKNLRENDPSFKGFRAVGVKASGSTIYKYIIGKHSTKTEAQAELSAIRKQFPDAFVVKVNGDVVTRP